MESFISIKDFIHFFGFQLFARKNFPGNSRTSTFWKICAENFKIIFFWQSTEKSIFSQKKNLYVLRRKNEHYPYIIRTPIIPVKILSHFNHFFNGGFT